MSSAFFGLHIGRSALMANQMAIDVTGHNLSNVSTEGYSRQRVESSQVVLQNQALGEMGAGVQATGIDRIQETYIERQLSRVQTQASFDTAMVSGLEELQSILGEPSDTGLGSALSDFWNSWESLSLRPTDAGLRTQVIEAAQNLALRYNERISGFETAETGFNSQIQSKVDEVNGLLQQVADLNLTIFKAEASGHPANDLRDQRDQAAREVAKLLGVEPEYVDGNVNLKLPDGGPYLVYGKDAYKLSTQTDPSGWVTGINLEIHPLDIQTGEIGAILELRDTSSVNLRNDLSELMARVTDRVNELHNGGYDLELRQGTNLFQWLGDAETVQLYPSSGLTTVVPGTALTAGTHHLTIQSVDQASGAPFAVNAFGTLTAGSIALSAVGDYAGEPALNLDYHVKILEGNAGAGDLTGMRVQLYKGDEAVGAAQTLGGGTSQAVTWTVDGVDFTANVDLGADSFMNGGERSDGLVTTGTVSLDAGLAVAVDPTLAYRYRFTGGSDNLYRTGAAADIEFGLTAFTGASFTVASNTGTLRVNPGVVADMGRIVAAAAPAFGSLSGPARGDGELARQMGNLATEAMFEYTKETSADRLGRTAQDLGEQAKTAATMETASTTILGQIDMQRQSISGVNTDEEMVLLIQFQRGFEAAARFVNTSDDMLDVIINRLGRVGL